MYQAHHDHAISQSLCLTVLGGPFHACEDDVLGYTWRSHGQNQARLGKKANQYPH
jgi:hypothetical protein